jgi:hypothetical protein
MTKTETPTDTSAFALTRVVSDGTSWHVIITTAGWKVGRVVHIGSSTRAKCYIAQDLDGHEVGSFYKSPSTAARHALAELTARRPGAQ